MNCQQYNFRPLIYLHIEIEKIAKKGLSIFFHVSFLGLKNFEFCLVLSRKGQTTSSIRRHLRSVHKMDEFEEKHVDPSVTNNSFNQLSIDQKRKLQSLAVNAIIQDGRSFNDLNKPGIAKLFNGLLDGTI